MPYNSLRIGEGGAIEIWDFMLSKGDKKQKYYILKSNVATGYPTATELWDIVINIQS